jgi:hypothetical protein
VHVSGEGDAVGVDVGDAVGDAVGVAVGDDVGDAVGDDVGDGEALPFIPPFASPTVLMVQPLRTRTNVIKINIPIIHILFIS